MRTGTGGALSVPPDPGEGSTSLTGRIGALTESPKTRHDRRRMGGPPTMVGWRAAGGCRRDFLLCGVYATRALVAH
jgi:hypothetical protein